MAVAENRRVVLAAHPVGEPKSSDFRLEVAKVPEPADGQVLMRVLMLSLDPYMRGRMNAASTPAPPIALGEVMAGRSVARIVASRNARFAVGDYVWTNAGWQEYALSDGRDIRKLVKGAVPLSTALGVLGYPGLTAYAGLLTIGQPKPGETVVVAAAAGPVGCTVGQIAKIKRARAVGIAGGAEKCRALVEEFGFDAAVDRRGPDFAARLAAACPCGIDVYFENVSGAVWDAVVPLLNNFARVPVCGMAADYNNSEGPVGPDRLPALLHGVLYRRLTLRGFLVTDYLAKLPDFANLPDFATDMSGWVASGELRYREHVVTGLEGAPEGLIAMLRGDTFGKTIVRVGRDEAA